jgi:enoyl-CoA hydratase
MTALPATTVFSVEQHDHVAICWLDREEARNAMGLEFFSELPEVMGWCSETDDVRAVVLQAKGSSFSVGLDLKAMGSALSGHGDGSSAKETSFARRAFQTRTATLRLQDSISAVELCTKPVIAAIHGHCIGGGVDLITACDFRLASSDATFSVRETKMAIVADLGSLQRLPKIIGPGYANEMCLSGKTVSATRASEMGLINEVFPSKEALFAGALASAQEIAQNAPLVVQGTKAVLAQSAGRSVADGLHYVAAWNAGMLASDDLTEAVTAFFEKRPPDFKGR